MKHVWLLELSEYMRLVEDGIELYDVAIDRLNELRTMLKEVQEFALIGVIDDIFQENKILIEVNNLPPIEEEDND